MMQSNNNNNNDNKHSIIEILEQSPKQQITNTSNTSTTTTNTIRQQQLIRNSVMTTSSTTQQQGHWCKHWVGFNNNGVSNTNTTTTLSSSVRSVRAVWVGRIVFITVLMAVAAIVGYVTYSLLTDAEENLANTQFNSIANRALVEAEEIAHRRRWAGVTMAAAVSELHPNATEWPFVEFIGFERLVKAILNTSSGVDMGFATLIKPEQVPAFENFAYETYNKLNFPNGTGYSSFGRGIWAQDPNGSAPDKRRHDITGETNYGSEYNILTPLWRTDEGPHKVLMFNTHSGKAQGEAVDRMLKCSEKRAIIEGQQQQNISDDNNFLLLTSIGESKCGVITDIFPIVKQNGRWGAALLRPIYPANDPYTIVGYIPTLFLVDELLDNVFADEVSGIDAVFKTETQSVTFTIENGVARFLGIGDYHDQEYDEYQQSITMLDHSLYTEDSPIFQFSLTPNENFYDVYKTNNPTAAMIGSVLIILIMSLAFFLYDFCVRREFNAKKELIEARRQFLRFVSHEVRTPLNSVYMGLDLVQEELASSIGFDSATSLRAHYDFDENNSSNNEYKNNKPDLSLADINNNSNQPQPHSITSEETTDEIIPYDHTTSLTKKKALSWFRLAEEIQSNAQGAVDILNDLLNYDKIEQGTLQLTLEVVSVWDLIEKVALEFKLPASSKNIRLGLKFCVQDETNNDQCYFRPVDLPTNIRQFRVIGDSIRLTQVLRNLLSNALKFTPIDGTINVQTSFVQDSDNTKRIKACEFLLGDGETILVTTGGYVKVTVSDTGAGMSSEQLDKLFSDGVQFNANKLQAGQGSGLGLFIAKGLVKQHNGDLSATSDGPDLGTCFKLVLPIWKVPDKEKQSSNRKKNDESGQHHFDHNESRSSEYTSSFNEPIVLRILVVDDVLSNRKLLRRLLEKEGHICDEAVDGIEAVEKVKDAANNGRSFHTVLMDYEMPGLSGPEAAKQIRDMGFIDTYIAGVTGNVLPEDVSYFRSCGANDVVSKPVKIANLESLWKLAGVYERSRREMYEP